MDRPVNAVGVSCAVFCYMVVSWGCVASSADDATVLGVIVVVVVEVPTVVGSGLASAVASVCV